MYASAYHVHKSRANMSHYTNILQFAELQLIVICAALGEIGVRTELFSPEDITILWCLAGGFVGSFCSLHFYEPPTRAAAGMQFGVNLSLSAVASPALVDVISYWTRWPVGIKLALPVSAGVGIVACAAVAAALPYLPKYIMRRSEKLIDDLDRE